MAAPIVLALGAIALFRWNAQRFGLVQQQLAASAMLLNLCVVEWLSVSRASLVAPHNPISS